MFEFKNHIWAEIDLDAIKHNVSAFKESAKGSRIIAVIKANAYGHGAVETAKLLSENGIDGFAVSSLREAIELRRAGIKGLILILGYTSPADAEALVDHNISQTVFSKEYALALSEKLNVTGKKLNIHIKLNTGMNRLGFNCKNPDEAAKEIAEILRLDCFGFEGIFTHFAAADRGGDPELEFTKLQADCFLAVCNALANLGFSPEIRHCCNSAGIITMPHMHLDAVRLGISLYGLTPDTSLPLPIKLQPAMSFKSTVAMVHTAESGDTVSYGRTFKAEKETLLATIPVGYADGYPRLLSGKGEVLINGSRCKIVGRVCMDQLVADITHLPDTKVGDEVVLFGRQGNEYISIEEIAELCGTINYEIICGISRRVPRHYYKNQKLVSTDDYVLREI